MTESTIITLAALEAIADEIVGEESQKREHLATMIRHYARILAVREPERFTRRATELSDEDGHYDNSYPPKLEWKDRSGPVSMRIVPGTYEQVATEGGFYHSWRAATSDSGLYITPTGEMIGATFEGEGRYGQFAAHPGDCSVMITVEWDRLDIDDVPTERLVEAEAELRDLAFPLIAERQKRA
jgi:hypothetical protein